ncbi:UDP-N-acetylglucosamine 2-epimerase [Legionella massiliensis]|uniref:UDP-N-acetylglucosamine 2-epimerase (non-hydrolyzing) n=1 Tax=Legionella massiliensis TaxID=1034943 RepID=A0A078L2R3_9GAMM|nr:UDP-N-acetylglucosamine 2-epimerase (non-hydrolyzing) [Legionella massiliensis]CDZ78313.1 UDP-N-acetylglucosamine 2-epimerase [Legionella massiliensis]CEE14051.1 UDP-N-acetylglucosamine 2-epimerase [Legionella massiliensis]
MSSTKQYTIGCIIGTRPEVIKMAPIIFKLKESSWAKVIVINTAQHRNLLDDMLQLFGIEPDSDLDIMTFNQSLGELTANLCTKLENLLQLHHFDTLLAAGDTTTVFISSLIAFYHRIPFGHVEAGLRSYNIYEPFPEEINRVLAAPLSTWHFAPTMLEKENLLRENINQEKVVVTGNPVIDALYWVLEHRKVNDFMKDLDNIVLVTTHRRENFGENLHNICSAIIELTERFTHLNFVFPVHPNPNVQRVVHELLKDKPRIHLLSPLKYDQFSHLMQRAILLLSDSGGVQEEGPALSKPVLVLRDVTERPAILTEGVGLLIGTEKNNIVSAVTHLLTDKNLYTSMSRGVSPYGDGHAAERIVASLEYNLINKNEKKLKAKESLVAHPKGKSVRTGIQP